MKKFGKRLIIIAIIGVVLYGAYFFFVRPKGFTSRSELAEAYFTNLSDAEACDTYFNPETISFCNTFRAAFSGQTVVVDAVSETASSVTVTISIGDSTDTFTVRFISESVTGLRGFLNPNYYYIDTIE